MLALCGGGASVSLELDFNSWISIVGFQQLDFNSWISTEFTLYIDGFFLCESNNFPPQTACFGSYADIEK